MSDVSGTEMHFKVLLSPMCTLNSNLVQSAKVLPHEEYNVSLFLTSQFAPYYYLLKGNLYLRLTRYHNVKKYTLLN